MVTCDVINVTRNEQAHPIDYSLRRSSGLFGAVVMSLITWVYIMVVSTFYAPKAPEFPGIDALRII